MYGSSACGLMSLLKLQQHGQTILPLWNCTMALTSITSTTSVLHLLFLTTINQQLSFFAESWNQHYIQIHDGPNWSPADLFGFDMLVHGMHGNQLPAEDNMIEEELEVFSVDWEGLPDERLLHSQQTNNSDSEGWTSWVGRVGPPENLSQVVVEPPNGPLQPHKVQLLVNALQPWFGAGDEDNVITLWNHGLAFACTLANNIFWWMYLMQIYFIGGDPW